jgi:hypothetical protein
VPPAGVVEALDVLCRKAVLATCRVEKLCLQGGDKRLSERKILFSGDGAARRLPITVVLTKV